MLCSKQNQPFLDLYENTNCPSSLHCLISLLHIDTDTLGSNAQFAQNEHVFFSLSAVQYEGKSLACVVLAAVVVLYYTSATEKGTFYSGLTVD